MIPEKIKSATKNVVINFNSKFNDVRKEIVTLYVLEHMSLICL